MSVSPRKQNRTDNRCKLFNDTQTFHSDLKKAVTKSLRADYELYPPPTAKTDEQRIAAVKKKADDLLSTAEYLHGDPDDQVSQSSHPFFDDLTWKAG